MQRRGRQVRCGAARSEMTSSTRVLLPGAPNETSTSDVPEDGNVSVEYDGIHRLVSDAQRAPRRPTTTATEDLPTRMLALDWPSGRFIPTRSSTWSRRSPRWPSTTPCWSGSRASDRDQPAASKRWLWLHETWYWSRAYPTDGVSATARCPDPGPRREAWRGPHDFGDGPRAAEGSGTPLHRGAHVVDCTHDYQGLDPYGHGDGAVDGHVQRQRGGPVETGETAVVLHRQLVAPANEAQAINTENG